VKPSNVLLGGDGRARLTDFGIVRLLDEASRQTATGITMGTAAYLAPEQVRGEGVTEASDVYALGLVLIEALTGRPVYQGAPAAAALARLVTPPAIPPVAPALAAVLGAMTAGSPAERPTAGQAAERLAAIEPDDRWNPGVAAPTPIDRAAVTHPTRVPGGRFRRGLLAVTGTGLVAAVVLFGGALPGRGPEPGAPSDNAEGGSATRPPVTTSRTTTAAPSSPATGTPASGPRSPAAEPASATALVTTSGPASATSSTVPATVTVNGKGQVKKVKKVKTKDQKGQKQDESDD
jgi:hypothetical protein